MGAYALHGKIRWEHRNRSGRLIRAYPWFENGIITAKLDDVINVYFDGAAATGATWYAGLIASSPTLSGSDTMASHAGWTEFQAYDESVRQTWGHGTSSSQLMVNSAAMVFTMTSRVDAGDIGGLFITSDSTKGGTSGQLWAHGVDAGPSLEAGDQLNAYYLLQIREV